MYDNNQQLQGSPARERDELDLLRDAINTYHSACHAFAEAQARRDQAKAALDKISADAARVLQTAMLDPTAPQERTPPPNGSALSGLARL